MKQLNKPNELISIVVNANAEINLIQKKAYNLFLKHAQDLVKFKNYKSQVFEIESIIVESIFSNKNTTYIREELIKLKDVGVTINDKNNPNNWEAFNLLSSIGKKGKCYRYELSQTIIKALKEQTFFTPLDLMVINSLNSSYSITLYELAKRYENYKIPRMTIEELRGILGTQKTYTIVRDLRKFVLDKACKEIKEKTNLEIIYQLEKTGKKYTHINFKTKKIINNSLIENKSKEKIKLKRKTIIKEIKISKPTVYEHTEFEKIKANLSEKLVVKGFRPLKDGIIFGELASCETDESINKFIEKYEL